MPGKHPSWAALPGPLTGHMSPTAMLDEDEEERVDETALRQLTEMGFPESRAVKALRLNQYVGPARGWSRVCPAVTPCPTRPESGPVCELIQRGALTPAPQSLAWTTCAGQNSLGLGRQPCFVCGVGGAPGGGRVVANSPQSPLWLRVLVDVRAGRSVSQRTAVATFLFPGPEPSGSCCSQSGLCGLARPPLACVKVLTAGGRQHLLEASPVAGLFLTGGKGPRDPGHVGRKSFLPFSMSVPQAMEWLIEHADDPAIDTPLPGHTSPGTTGAEASAEAAAGSSEDDEEARDELTEIFKKIRRKRAFRADARVRVLRGDPPLSPWVALPGPRAEPSRQPWGHPQSSLGPGGRFL